MPTKDLTINLVLDIAAPRERVWRALTDPAELAQWLTDADVDLAGGRYELHGNGLLEVPAESPTRLLKADAPELLEFNWRLRGENTTVRIELLEENGATEVRVTHTEVAARPSGGGGTTDFWVLALENLRQHCLGGDVVRYDFSRAGADVTMEVQIAAPREAVFEALLSPTVLEEFWSSGATIEPHAGGRYDYGWGSGGPSRILELQPERKLTVDWQYGDEPASIVTWELADSGGGTRLTLTHTGFGAGNREDYRLGWLGLLVPLKARAELGERWSRVRTDGYEVENDVVTTA